MLQEDSNGVDHPVCYFSKKFSKHQRNYTTVEKEYLSLILSFQHLKICLASSSAPIIVFSDRNPLTFINKTKKKSALAQMEPFLHEYSLDIRHVKGKDNIVTYALSRI